MVIKRTPPRHPNRGPSCLLVLFVIVGVVLAGFVMDNAETARDMIIPTATLPPTRSATEYALQAQFSEEEGDIAGAVSYYGQALRLDASKPQIYIRYIGLLVEYGCLELTIGEVTQSISCIDEALARSQEAIVLAPEDPYIWTAVAAAYMANGSRLYDGGDPVGANLEYAQAVSAAERAINLATGEDEKVLANAYAYVAGGLVSQQQPELYQEARVNAETAITIDPDNAFARYQMGRVFTYLGFYDLALEQFQFGLQVDPNFTDLYIELGYNSYANSRLAEAITWFNEAIKRDPNSASAYDGLAYMYLQLGEDVQAEANARKSVELNPNVARAHGRLGEAYMRTNKFDLAIEEFTKATTLYGEPTANNLRFFYLLGDAYIRAGLENCPQAIPLFQAVSEMNNPIYTELSQEKLVDCRRTVLETDS